MSDTTSKNTLKFHYQPIVPPVGDELNIRLITILPDPPSADIKCTIAHHSQPENTRYHTSIYSALSYMWGPDVISRTITLNGCTFPVRENLWLALKRLRLEDSERLIWIDALCINQEDIEERNTQVAQMGKVYDQAKNILIWLGPDNVGLYRNAMAILKDATKSPQWYRQPKYWREIMKQWEKDPDNKATASPEWQALVAFCRLDYWKRVWIIQEVIMGARIELFWGKGEMTWDNLFEILDQVSAFEDDENYGLEFRETSWVVTESMPFRLAGQKLGGGKVYTFGHDDIVDLVMSYREAQCFDPRDKVFGMSGITGSKIVVDYSRSLAEVCGDVLREKFRTSYDKEPLLSHAQDKPWRGDWDVKNLNTISLGSDLLRILQGELIDLKDALVTNFPAHHADVIYTATANVSGVVSFLSETLDSYRDKSVEILAKEALQHQKGEWNNEPTRKQLDFLNTNLIQNPESFAKHLQDTNKTFTVPITENISHAEDPPTDSEEKVIDPFNLVQKLPLQEAHESGSTNLAAEDIIARLISTAASQLPPHKLSETKLFCSNSGLIGLLPKEARLDDRICTFRDSQVLVVTRQDKESRHAIVGLGSSLDENIKEQSVKGGRFVDDEIPDHMARCFLSIKLLLLMCWFRCTHTRKDVTNWSRPQYRTTSNEKPLPFQKRRLNYYLR